MYWWQTDNEEEIGNLLSETIHEMQDDHMGRRTMNLDMLRMYTQREYNRLDRFDPSQRMGMPIGEDFRMRLNVIGNIVDTLVSRIGKAKPKPMYLTRRGDYKLRQRARRLTDVMEGIFHQSGLFNLMPKIFLDSCVFDVAALKVGRDGNDIFVERVFPNELYWDINASLYMETPPSLHQVKEIPVEQLVLQFPEKEQEIRYYAHGDESSYMGQEGHDAKMVEVAESWHLPSITGADDGMHAITMDNLVLMSEQYTYNKYPFVFLRWGDSVLGFSGVSLAEQLKSIQFEINKLALRIQQSMHLLSVPWVFVQAGSRVVDSHIRNQPGCIINYVGQPPVTYTPQAMHPEVYAHMDRLYQRAYEIAGVSELSASGKKPAGLESGAALRVYHDIETERFMNVAQRYEDAFMQAAEWFMDLAREIVEESGSFPVKGIKAMSLEELDFKDIDMAQNDFVLQAYPVSLLPSTPAGRLAAVTELMQTGVINSREHIVRLLDFPDLQSVTSMYDALERDVEWRISEIIDSNIYHAPEPLMDLAFAKERMTIAYLEAQQDELELGKLTLMLQFIDECDALMAAAKQPLPGAQAETVETPAQTGTESPAPPADGSTPLLPNVGAGPAVPEPIEGLPEGLPV